MGYNVVFSDPAGSTGHGYAFEEALENNYGDAMFQDVQAVMDAAVRRPDVDATRLGVLGGSYGGYATLWVIAHTDRYKVAVAERAVSNLQSENLAADFAGEERLRRRLLHMGAAVGSGKHRLRQVLSADVRRRTCIRRCLILHADEDTRAPIDQTLQEFTSLKILGRTVEYVAVPRREPRPLAHRFADPSRRALAPDPRLVAPLPLRRSAEALAVTGRSRRAS